MCKGNGSAKISNKKIINAKNGPEQRHDLNKSIFPLEIRKDVCYLKRIN